PCPPGRLWLGLDGHAYHRRRPERTDGTEHSALAGASQHQGHGCGTEGTRGATKPAYAGPRWHERDGRRAQGTNSAQEVAVAEPLQPTRACDGHCPEKPGFPKWLTVTQPWCHKNNGCWDEAPGPT